MGQYFHLDGKQLQQQYKNHLSDYNEWDQRVHAKDWMLFEKNIGEYLSIDETSLSNGELYTIITNKEARGRKGTIVAMIKGTESEYLIKILKNIPESKRKKVKEITLDMAPSLNLVAKHCFPKASRVTDRFHVQKLAFEAVQEMRIKYRWEAIDSETEALNLAKKEKKDYTPEVFENGDTRKQMLARSRYLLFKNKYKWTESQKARAKVLFEQYPKLEEAYNISMKLSNIFNTSTTTPQAFTRLARWYDEVEKTEFSSFKTVSRSIQMHYLTILNYFDNRSTNASAESFNAKIKAFRATQRGVRDVDFFLFRLKNIYA